MKVVFSRVAAQLPSQKWSSIRKTEPKAAQKILIIYSMQVCASSGTKSAAAASLFEQVAHMAVHELAILGADESLEFGLDRLDTSPLSPYLWLCSCALVAHLTSSHDTSTKLETPCCEPQTRRKLSSCSETGCSNHV